MSSQIIDFKYDYNMPDIAGLSSPEQPVIGVNALPIPVAVLDINDGSVIYANPLFLRVIPACVVGHKIKGFFDEPSFLQTVLQKVQDKGRVVFVKKISANNQLKKLKFSLTECSFNSKTRLLISVEYSKEEDSNSCPANYVQLNTLDRAEFINHLAKLLNDKNLLNEDYCLCSIDIDRFRIMNELFGYEAGSYILDETYKVIKKQLPIHSVLCRMGSNDYALILKNLSIDEGVEICEKICVSVREHSYFWDDKSIDLTLSIGIVPIRFGADDVNSSLSYADIALRAAQDNGRDRVHSSVQEDTMMYVNASNIEYMLVIENQLKKDEFELYAQPIVLLDDPSVLEHYEILIRSFNSKLGEYYLSQELIQAAETFDVITKIDQWICTNIFKKLQECVDQGIKIPYISINISGHSIVNSEFDNFIRNLVSTHSLPINHITFEITENVAVKSISRAQKFIMSMRELGFKFALDDFGVGYCSFNYLQQLDVDVVKIDGVFVASMLENPTQFAMVKAIADVAQAMNIRTVAEYVDNPEIIKALSAVGVDYGQGYIFGKPQPIDKYLFG